MAESFVFPPREYCKEDISSIMSSIRKSNSAVIIGLPGIGKSTIARLITDSKRKVWQDHLSDTGKRYHFVHIDYSFNPSFQEVMRRVRRELVKQGLSIPQDSNSFEVLDSLFAAEDLTTRHFVLVFDGYDEVSDEQARALLNRLRQLRNYQMNMSFLFVGRREPQTLYEIDELIDAVYYISPLNERDQRVTIKRHEKRLRYTFDVEQKSWLLSYCGGWPGLIKYTCDLLYDKKIAAEDDIISICLAEQRIKQICQEMWADLSVDEKARFIDAAVGRNFDRADDLTGQLKTKHLLNHQANIFAEIFKGYILSLPESQPELCTWQMRPLQLLVTGQKEEYRIDLTRKEIELLSMLMKKSPAVVSSDEIWETIWPNKVVGLTRIIKLISRLRLKIDGTMQ